MNTYQTLPDGDQTSSASAVSAPPDAAANAAEPPSPSQSSASASASASASVFANSFLPQLPLFAASPAIPTSNSRPASGIFSDEEAAHRTSRAASAPVFIPSLYVSPASAGPGIDPGLSQAPRPSSAAGQQLHPLHPVSSHSALSPGSAGSPRSASPGGSHTTVAAPAVPTTDKTSTHFCDSGFVAVGLVAASIGIGINSDINRNLLASFRHGGPLASPWQHMEEFLYDLRLYDDEFPTRNHSPRQHPKSVPCSLGDGCPVGTHLEQPLRRTIETERLIHRTKTRLKTMLNCQYSFGSVIGAPVIFFLGGFIFALLQSLDALGDENIALGLAFGQWYMTIPHIAIISGLLLAGNNPNIFEGVLAVDRNYHHDNINILGVTYGLAYPSCYKVAWLWGRGHNKKKWLDTLVTTYLIRRDAKHRGRNDKDMDIKDLKKRITLSLSDWFLLLCLAMLLIGVPFVLAFLTAYFTPEIGLSCRSLTFTIYLMVQTCQILLWLWAYAGPTGPSISDVDNPGFFSVGGWLDRSGFYQPYSLRWLVGRSEAVPRGLRELVRLAWEHSDRLHNWRMVWNVLYFASMLVLGIIAITAAIGGTVMQLMGVYSANICTVTVPYWFRPLADRPKAMISTNSAEMIRDAQKFWKPCAITAILFMSVVTFVAWWYQRRMRDMFTDQVTRIDQRECEETRRSHTDYVSTPVHAHTAMLPVGTSAAYTGGGGGGGGAGAASGLTQRTPFRQTPSPRPLSTSTATYAVV